jgi:proteasome lid subunit RPN8/RPN11
MVRHAVQEFPNECCGLLAGRIKTDAQGESIATVEERFPLVNELASPVEFTSEPRSMFEAVRSMDRRGLATLAVYHSHPTSDAIPSNKDLERSYDAGVMNLIVSLNTGTPRVDAWWLVGARYEKAPWELVEDDGAATASN